ncbi:hypothetical protein TREMEDRAFT_16292, partial [Tremella mesenterica DSM 1558]
HHSMPPPARVGSSIGQNSGTFSRVSYQSGKRSSSGGSVPTNVKLPPDLEKVLTVLTGGILQGHLKLAAALRKRYDNQYPLVRSLADVFNSHSYILREYATYILHLEPALMQVDQALQSVMDKNGSSRRLSKRVEETEIVKLGRALMSLEELAAERGESGLVISLSKPFQRLLKYPLLFQNLLFNTDPSLKEYEKTLEMVDEVEMIVRSIEDEKSSQEEREKTRDVWARIDGLEKDKMLMAPKPNRLLISETAFTSPNSLSSLAKDETIRQKKSMKRLSDMLKSSHDPPDTWVVKFSDVSLLCLRVGTTQLPLSTTSTSKSSKLSQMDPDPPKKFNTTRRGGSVKPRNLYRFIKIHEWHLKPKTG